MSPEKPRPQEIEESVRSSNYEHLSQAGRKGAAKTNAIKAEKKSRAEQLEDAQAAEAAEMAAQLEEELAKIEAERGGDPID